ncbi:MAG: four helix bundle protein [Bacteroidetes bacterium]|nr:four helix bundle protein [Bacteroidota bacterium]
MKFLCLFLRTYVLSVHSGSVQIKDQIFRSCGSTMDNIAEGFDRDHKNEFIYFLYVAKGSCAEVRSQIHRMYDFGIIDDDRYSNLIKKAITVSKLIAGLIRYLKTTSHTGHRKK